MIGARFDAACRRLGLNVDPPVELDITQFIRDPHAPSQGSLFL